jgi:hypothetical protein
MTVGQLLDDIRERYLTQFRRSISEVQEAGMEAWVEPAYCDEDAALAREGELGLPLRLDLVGVADGEAQERVRVDSDSMLSFEPIDFEWRGLPTRLAPFHWDSCHVRVTGVPKPADWSHLHDWFDHWFDSEDTRQPDSDGLCGVIHFLSDPKRKGAATVFEVDFGSAPVEAFEEFLDALRDSGATKIEIGYDQG